MSISLVLGFDIIDIVALFFYFVTLGHDDALLVDVRELHPLVGQAEGHLQDRRLCQGGHTLGKEKGSANTRKKSRKSETQSKFANSPTKDN